jgi:hypothetical protein
MNQLSLSGSLAILSVFTALIFGFAFMMVNRRTNRPAA